MDLFWYDGEQIRRFTTDGERENLANQSPVINDRGEIVWTRYDFCPDPWESKIMFRSPDGNVKELTRPGMLEPQIPSINNRSQASWHFVTEQNRRGTIVIWEAGNISPVTDWGRNSRLNDLGDISFNRWHDDSQTWQVWLYRKKQILQLSDDPFWNRDGDINNAGEVAWRSGDTQTSDIRYMRRFPSGDLNCDGSLDLTDVEPFILALIDPDEYPKQYPACDLMLGDVNADGSVDLVDVEPFIELLLK